MSAYSNGDSYICGNLVGGDRAVRSLPWVFRKNVPGGWMGRVA